MLNKKLDKDLELIDEAMNRFVQAMSRPRAWEGIAERAGVNIDRAGATLLHFLSKPSPDGCHLSEIAHRLGIEAPSVTRKVQQLERQKLVKRVADPKDHRAYVLEVTKEGKSIIKRLHKAKHDLFAEIISDWPADERHAFASLFYKLSQGMANYQQQSDLRTKPQEQKT